MKCGNYWADPLVMLDWVMLCVVISQVSVSGSPVNVELFLVHSILDPVESHIHGSRADLSHSAIGNTSGSGVINLYWCWWLRMSEFFAGGANGNGFLAIKEGGADFGFGGTGHYGLDNFGL